MEKEYFLNSGIQPHNTLQHDHSMATYGSLFSIQELNCSSEQQTINNFITPSFDNSRDNFDSTLSSMLSSSATTSSPSRHDGCVLNQPLRNLTSANLSNELRPPSQRKNTMMPMMDQFVNDNLPSFPSLVSDPGFAERAAKFSCFGSRSFNGRSSELGCNNNGDMYSRSGKTLMKFPRVSSSPSLKQDGNMTSSRVKVEKRSNSGLSSEFDIQNLNGTLSGCGAKSNDDSSVTEQAVNEEGGFTTPNGSISSKRKALLRGTPKDDSRYREAKVDENDNAKRPKVAEGNGNVHSVEEEEEAKGGNKANTGKNECKEQEKGNVKAPESPKDYIHVRARRGQATDSHSLAERVRREKISERMKLLQDIVPGCDKVTGKALMLDEIINYVQALQRQVEFLSMKLASVNQDVDIEENNVMSEDMFQTNASHAHQKFPFYAALAEDFYSHQHQENPQLHTNNCSSVSIRQSVLEPLDSSTFCSSLGMQLPALDSENFRFSS